MCTEHMFKTNYYTMLVHFLKYTNILLIDNVIVLQITINYIYIVNHSIMVNQHSFLIITISSYLSLNYDVIKSCVLFLKIKIQLFSKNESDIIY